MHFHKLQFCHPGCTFTHRFPQAPDEHRWRGKTVPISPYTCGPRVADSRRLHGRATRASVSVTNAASTGEPSAKGLARNWPSLRTFH